MDKPISVGDLVQIVFPREACGCDEDLGTYFVVRYIRQSMTWTCGSCGLTGPRARLVAYGDRMARGLHRLKRIPPLEELEGEQRDENLTEPA